MAGGSFGESLVHKAWMIFLFRPLVANADKLRLGTVFKGHRLAELFPFELEDFVAWLLRDADVLGSVEVHSAFYALVGPYAIGNSEKIVACSNAKMTHSLHCSCEITAVFCDRSMKVISVHHLNKGRVSLPVARSKWLVLANERVAQGWSIKVGDQLELRR